MLLCCKIRCKITKLYRNRGNADGVFERQNKEIYVKTIYLVVELSF